LFLHIFNSLSIPFSHIYNTLLKNHKPQRQQKAKTTKNVKHHNQKKNTKKQIRKTATILLLLRSKKRPKYKSNKTRIETCCRIHHTFVISSPKRKSNKTRIETCCLYCVYSVSVTVQNGNPTKQGLKLTITLSGTCGNFKSKTEIQQNKD